MDRFWIIILICLVSCRSVQKKSSSQSSESFESSNSETLSLQDIDISTQMRKSLDKELQSLHIGRTIIYPTDVFRYSEQDGFEGKADSIVIIKEEVKNETVSEVDTSQIQESQLIIEGEKQEDLSGEKQESEQSETERKPSLVPWIGGALGVAIVLGLVIFWLRRSGRFFG